VRRYATSNLPAVETPDALHLSTATRPTKADFISIELLLSGLAKGYEHSTHATALEDGSEYAETAQKRGVLGLLVRDFASFSLVIALNHRARKRETLFRSDDMADALSLVEFAVIFEAEWLGVLGEIGICSALSGSGLPVHALPRSTLNCSASSGRFWSSIE
jgi:hypothetical protein